jgi:phosphate transport system substrate-binding protein
VGGKGNEGVASFVSQIDGSIGYVEYAFALQTQMIFTQVKNKAGQFISPSLVTFKAAAQSADWTKAKDFYLLLTDMNGKNAWPIVGSTFALIPKTPNAERTRQLLAFFQWAHGKEGASMAEELGYIPLPDKVVSLIQQTLPRP